MNIDASKSKYHESSGASEEFTRQELKALRMLLRRLRFLEHKAREEGNDLQGNGGAVFNELEIEGLEFVLDEIGFLAEVIDTTGART